MGNFIQADLKQNEQGQGLVEYSLILVLVAVVVVVVVALLGPAIGGVFSQVNNALQGKSPICGEQAHGGVLYKICVVNNTGTATRVSDSKLAYDILFYTSNPGSCPAHHPSLQSVNLSSIFTTQALKKAGFNGQPTHACLKSIP